MLCVVLVSMDLPAARLHYTVVIHQSVTIPKAAGLACLAEEEVPKREACLGLPELASALSKARTEALEAARSFHPLGNYAGQLFDWARGRNRTIKEEMISKRSPERIIQSVDKKNPRVDMFCAVVACFQIAAIAHLLKRLVSSCLVGADTSLVPPGTMQPLGTTSVSTKRKSKKRN